MEMRSRWLKQPVGSAPRTDKNDKACYPRTHEHWTVISQVYQYISSSIYFLLGWPDIPLWHSKIPVLGACRRPFCGSPPHSSNSRGEYIYNAKSNITRFRFVDMLNTIMAQVPLSILTPLFSIDGVWCTSHILGALALWNDWVSCECLNESQHPKTHVKALFCLWCILPMLNLFNWTTYLLFMLLGLWHTSYISYVPILVGHAERCFGQ